MEADKSGTITLADMVIRLIADNQLSAEEEIKIKKMIEEKQRERGGRCLAVVIDMEMTKKLPSEDIRMKNMYQSVYQKCFKKSRVGNMDSLKLTEKIISKYKRDVRELYGLNENEMVFFMGMLQVGLDKMAEEGILNFVPDKEMFHNFMNPKTRTSYIDNPYTNEETVKIMEWSELHSTDMRGMAVSLWFAGGISLTEIVNLTKKDCWGGKRQEDSIMEFEERLFDAGISSKIAAKALNLHPREVRYVFAVPRRDGTGWKKLTEIGLQRKLNCICRDIGIAYKNIAKNEAIRHDKDPVK